MLNLTDSEKEEIQNLVLSASGANYERGDVVTVSSLQFESLAEEQKQQEILEKEIRSKSTAEFLTRDVGPLVVVLILGLSALFVIRGLIGKSGRVVQAIDSPTRAQTIEPQLPQITEDIPDMLFNEAMPKIEANIYPELEHARMELNDAIMADPEEAARLLVSFIKE